MLLRIKFFYQKITSSFWFLPSFILLMNIVLAVVLIWVDRQYPITPSGLLNVIFSKNADSGREVLNIIAGSMSGIAGTVFSITLVILQLATSQLGPRLLNNFMYQRINQIVLGQYIGLFLYCLIVINSIRDGEGYKFIPHISIIAAIIFAIVNIFMLIFYIHSVSMSIQPSKVIYQLGKNLKNKADELYPDLDGDVHEAFLEDVKNRHYVTKMLRTPKSGYIQYFDIDGLLEFSEEHRVIIEVLQRPGAYIVEGQPIFELLGTEQLNIEDSELDSLFSNYEVYRSKSLFQDTEFAILQIVEIASRALSPGINDPHTAIICIDQLTDSLNMLGRTEQPKPYITKDAKKVMLIVNQRGFEHFLDTAFDEIRFFGASTPSVIFRLMESIEKLLVGDMPVESKVAVQRYAKKIMETAEQSFKLERDLDMLRDQYRKVMSYNL